MTCRAMVMCVTIDLPEKSKLMNFTQFSGVFGCSVCKHEGEQVAVGRGTCVNPHINHAASYKDGKKALRTMTVNKLKSSCLNSGCILFG